MKNKSAFTLIELLIVIAVIALISTLALTALNNARKKARDAKRLADIKQIITTLELYYDNNKKYPGPTSSYGEAEGACGGWDSSTVDNDSDGRSFIEPLIDVELMGKVPRDPIGTAGTCGGYNYRYFRYNAGSNGCDSSRGAFYVISINDMETSGNPYSSSPGWSCPGRNWQGEFDWVTGGFEN
ncbi:MAG: putative General secretion pathway protein GspG [Parcubacteria group bacterium Athens1014_10]|nr:MAG: putative General secretion pathway protein GspG [Parcubacteria group bacterium Athens1014_10]TSD05999.1 MAG: putative General secretion pathway protein GspG [Parcubacteria group bacterium Athens0714_12]